MADNIDITSIKDSVANIASELEYFKDSLRSARSAMADRTGVSSGPAAQFMAGTGVVDQSMVNSIAAAVAQALRSVQHESREDDKREREREKTESRLSDASMKMVQGGLVGALAYGLSAGTQTSISGLIGSGVGGAMMIGTDDQEKHYMRAALAGMAGGAVGNMLGTIGNIPFQAYKEMGGAASQAALGFKFEMPSFVNPLAPLGGLVNFAMGTIPDYEKFITTYNPIAAQMGFSSPEGVRRSMVSRGAFASGSSEHNLGYTPEEVAPVYEAYLKNVGPFMGGGERGVSPLSGNLPRYKMPDGTIKGLGEIRAEKRMEIVNGDIDDALHYSREMGIVSPSVLSGFMGTARRYYGDSFTMEKLKDMQRVTGMARGASNDEFIETAQQTLGVVRRATHGLANQEDWENVAQASMLAKDMYGVGDKYAYGKNGFDQSQVLQQGLTNIKDPLKMIMMMNENPNLAKDPWELQKAADRGVMADRRLLFNALEGTSKMYAPGSMERYATLAYRADVKSFEGEAMGKNFEAFTAAENMRISGASREVVTKTLKDEYPMLPGIEQEVSNLFSGPMTESEQKGTSDKYGRFQKWDMEKPEGVGKGTTPEALETEARMKAIRVELGEKLMPAFVKLTRSIQNCYTAVDKVVEGLYKTLDKAMDLPKGGHGGGGHGGGNPKSSEFDDFINEINKDLPYGASDEELESYRAKFFAQEKKKGYGVNSSRQDWGKFKEEYKNRRGHGEADKEEEQRDKNNNFVDKDTLMASNNMIDAVKEGVKQGMSESWNTTMVIGQDGHPVVVLTPKADPTRGQVKPT